MPTSTTRPFTWGRRIVVLSLLLYFCTIPHTLEDFALGMPAEAGVPATVLSLVVALIFSLQALGIFWLGQKKRAGLIVHIVIGLFWPIGSGFAQLPTILSEPVYRAGLISEVFVYGMIAIGVLLVIFAILGLRER